MIRNPGCDLKEVGMDAEEGRTFVQCAVLPLEMGDTMTVGRDYDWGIWLGGGWDVLVCVVKEIG